MSIGTVLIGLVLSMDTRLGQAAPLVMAAEAIPKPPASHVADMEAVPE